MWIHVPETYSASVAESGESSLDSTQPWMEDLARSVTWKTKSVSPASLRRAWKTVPSIQRLSGLTLNPSVQRNGVAKWISSLEDSHVSHTASREASSEKMTQGNSAEKSLESPTGLDFQTSFLKTSPESSDSTGTPSDPNYERWVTKLRKDSSQRQKQAHLIAANGSSSWPTPNATTHGEGDTNWKERRQRIKEQGINGNGFGLTLGMAATNWPTPNVSDHLDPNNKDNHDVEKKYLRGVATNWPTPNTRDYKGFDSPGKENTHQNPEMYLSIHQDQTTTQDGSGSSLDGPDSPPPTAKKDTMKDTMCSPKCRRLSANFAEPLIGLPQGWPAASEPVATGLFQSWRLRLIDSLRSS